MDKLKEMLAHGEFKKKQWLSKGWLPLGKLFVWGARRYWNGYVNALRELAGEDI